MIKIFNASDKIFTSAGNITIEPTKCIETRKKSLNGWFIDVEIPIKYKENIQQDMLCVIKSKSKVNPQAFRIKNIEYTSRKIVFQAQHVMFDAEDYFLFDVRPTEKNGQNALSYINERTDKISPFTVFSNVTTTNTAYFIRKNMLEAWTTIEEKWNGVFDADNWNISFLQEMGNDNGETINYGQNLAHISVYEDWSDVCTKVFPVGYDGVTLPEQCLESEEQYEQPYTRKVEFETNLESEKVTNEALVTELRENALKYLKEHQYPKISYEVSANINERLEMCDKVHIKHPLCNILTEVLEYTYNTISEKTKTIIFGNYSRDVKTKFNTIKDSLNKVGERLSKQDIAIKHQTDLINTLNKNGYVYIDDNEILILDTLPKENAKNVWRFGLGGIGFSSNGYEGPFEIAITMDGQINADFITTGLMSVSRIEGLSNLLNNISVAIELNENNITQIVEQIGEQNQRISETVQSLDEIRSHISEIADITTSADGNGSVFLANVNKSEPIRLEIMPRGEDISYLYPKNNLFPSNNLFLKNRKVRFATKKYSIEWKLPTNLLWYDEENYDELILDYGGQSCVVNKRVGYNADGTKYLLDKPKTLTFTYPRIPLEEGDYTVTVLGYSSAYLFVRLMCQNIYTDQFATKAEMNSTVTQTAEKIESEVNKTLTNYVTTVQMNSSIEQKATSILSTVSETYATKTTLDTTKTTLQSQISQTSTSILNTVRATYATQASLKASLELKVDTEKLISEINASADKIELTAGRLIITTGNFKLDDKGNIIAINANVTGTITATAGKIGNFEIKDGWLNVKNGNIVTEVSDTGYNIWHEYTIGGGILRTEIVSINFDGSNTYVNFGGVSGGTGTLKVDKVIAETYAQSSTENVKKNIVKFNKNATEIIKNSDIYEYNYKREKDTDKKHIGFVIGNNYKTAVEVITSDKEGIDTYAQGSILWKFAQETIERIEKLQKRVAVLEGSEV